MNESWTWILWTILGVVLVIAEVFTPGFVLLWFGVGALAAALAAFLGAGLAAQFILFIVVSSSQGALNEGAVKVFGSVWTAYPAEGEPPLEAGDRVVVERLQGASIYVRRAGSIPDWRARELPDGEAKN